MVSGPVTKARAPACAAGLPFYNPAVNREAILLVVTIATLTAYVIGIGGTTATAIRIREAWRHRKIDEGELTPRAAGEVVLPTQPALVPLLAVLVMTPDKRNSEFVAMDQYFDAGVMTRSLAMRLVPARFVKMPEADEWQDPRVRPNVILYRLNRALTPTHRTLVHRLIGFTYYDGTIRNAFGVPTPLLLRTLRDWQQIALDAEALPLRPA